MTASACCLHLLALGLLLAPLCKNPFLCLRGHRPVEGLNVQTFTLINVVGQRHLYSQGRRAALENPAAT